MDISHHSVLQDHPMACICPMQAMADHHHHSSGAGVPQEAGAGAFLHHPKHPTQAKQPTQLRGRALVVSQAAATSGSA